MPRRLNCGKRYQKEAVMNNRGQRINSEMARAVQSIIGTLKDPRIKGIVSVQKAEVTNDLKHAKIYLSVFSQSQEEKKMTFDRIEASRNFIRRELMGEIDLRAMPELHFVLDASLENSIKINEILKSIHEQEEVKKHE